MGDGDAQVISKLIQALEAADKGDSVLDLRLSRCPGIESPKHVGAGDSALLADFKTETVEDILGEMVSPFTRSLDACLPGENIVFSMFSERRNSWVAVDRDSDGNEWVSWASTETLARRAAALRRILGDARYEVPSEGPGSVGDDRIPERVAESDPGEQSTEHDGADDDPVAWEVRF